MVAVVAIIVVVAVVVVVEGVVVVVVVAAAAAAGVVVVVVAAAAVAVVVVGVTRFSGFPVLHHSDNNTPDKPYNIRPPSNAQLAHKLQPQSCS